MLTAQMAIDYKELGVRVVSISPGWVKTDMGGNGSESMKSRNPFVFSLHK